MYSLFHDNRAPPDTTFSVWEGEEKEGGDAILLISFYTIQLANYESISLQGSVGDWNKHFFLYALSERAETALPWLRHRH
ncbi:uncharacterized protein LOC108143143 [Drosophila elegans]|uniref:uncharacterized protein LOC108143143 n=1 Tax=Drosophila elegans TaxID=30023 RepID=UPI0007E80501|nr:uncharacterized protein LOC108143143 [Drosophila elegans]